MKKFKIIRNILIIVIILIATIYIFGMRSSNIDKSKSYKLFSDLYSMEWGDGAGKAQATMQISYKDDKLDALLIYASDYKEEKEISINSVHYKNSKDDMGKGIWTMSEEGIRHIVILPEEKLYRDYGIVDDTEINSYNEWINQFMKSIRENDYYTRGYEFINGKLLYYEKFKKTDMKFYFDKEKLVYMKSTGLDESFNDVKNGLFTVKLTYDDEYKKFTEIPDDYEKIPDNYREEAIVVDEN